MGGKQGTSRLTPSVPPTLPPASIVCLIHPGQIVGARGLLPGAPDRDGAGVSGRAAGSNSVKVLL